ncbi:hypothetical protein JYT83_01160 [bacterium AH-315-F18]|nr:hypothetical protein [bacterium AH-315-F18]
MKEDAVTRYLKRHADPHPRPLVANALENIEMVVVIPALAERAYLPDTLTSLGANGAAALRRTLVLCVVNNRALPHAEEEALADNQDTLILLDGYVHGHGPTLPDGLRLAYVDASSPGRTLPPKDGVGLARKIGLDWGLKILHRQGAHAPVLLSLDADTRVAPNYLDAVRAHFDPPDTWAGVIAYRHRAEGTPQEREAVMCYELYLRYHESGLKYARSPYAFHTIGSTMACTAKAYATVGGMNRKQAGEDFHFLQKLAKTGPVDTITSTTVYPSGRASWRVPFGTGARIRSITRGPRTTFEVYHPDTYGVLRGWLALVKRNLDASAETILHQALASSPPLHAYLQACRFAETWEKLRSHSPGQEQLIAQFHRWFDGLKTLRLIHHLRDHGLPQQDLFLAVPGLEAKIGQPLQGLGPDAIEWLNKDVRPAPEE